MGEGFLLKEHHSINMTSVFLHLTSHDLNLDSTKDGSIFYKNMGLFNRVTICQVSQGMEVPIFNLNETCHGCWDQPKTQFEEEKFLRVSTLLEIGGRENPPFSESKG